MAPSTKQCGNQRFSFKGISPTQTVNNFKDSEQIMTRKILRDSWDNAAAVGNINGYRRVITPFRAVNHLGDFLARQNYVCGGPNQINADRPGWKSIIGSIVSNCDTTGVPAGSGNSKFVSDSSDYVTYKRQSAIVKNYNDYSFGGDENNASYVKIMAVRRF
jgi:hypothetical protein